MSLRRGLTLIEVVVTLVVASLAMASGFAALSTIVDRRSAALARINREMAAAELRAMLTRWIASAVLTIEEDQVEFRGLDGERHGIPDDVLELRTAAVTTATDPGSLIRLFIDRSDSTTIRGLCVEVRQPNETAPRYLELEPNVSALDVRYLSGHMGALTWSTSWVSSTVLPLAAEVTLGAPRPDAISNLLRLPILVPVYSR